MIQYAESKRNKGCFGRAKSKQNKTETESKMKEMITKEPEAAKVGERGGGEYRPRVSYYHPNGKGTGCAMTVTLIPATNLQAGGLMLEFAMQSSVANRDGEVRTFPRFDWANRIAIKLDMVEATKLLEVFRGLYYSLEDGKGLFVRGEKRCTVFKMEHRVEPVQGYLLSVNRKEVGGDEKEDRAWIVLTMTEALGLSLAIEQSMAAMAFGINK